MEATPLTLHQMIIHKVDHQKFDAPRLADVESPITPEAESFLLRQIRENREHKYTRTARFKAVDPNRVCLEKLCTALLQTKPAFVPQSRAIAEHLFNAMKSDRRIAHLISPGDLVVCTYSENKPADPTEPVRQLALLKMDPQDGFTSEWQQTPEGKNLSMLKRIPDVLPSGELQKCAFILPQALRREKGFDLWVLDQQAARYGIRRMVASFFLVDFLQCQVEFDRADLTQAFIYDSQEWVDRKKGQWPDAEINEFKEQVIARVQDKTVDVTAFAQTAIADAAEQEEYLEHLRARGLRQLAFPPDAQVRARFSRYVYFEGDNGLQVRIDPNAIGAGKTLVHEYDDHTKTHTIRIRTATWAEKYKKGR